jgi:small membrane protein
VIIKVLLLVGLAGAAILLLRGRRSALGLLLRRSMAIVAILIGGLAVLFPDAVTMVANAVGVGRGTDLVVYALCVVFLFVTIAQNLRITELHDRTVELARKHALLEAELHERETQASGLPTVCGTRTSAGPAVGRPFSVDSPFGLRAPGSAAGPGSRA